MPERVSVLVVDDHRVIAEGLAALIRGTDDLEVAGVAHSAAEALEGLSAVAPDVILLDQLLHDRTGVEVVGEIKSRQPDAAIVMLTSSTDESVLAAAFEAGAAGHLLKTEAAEQVLDAIRLAARGEIHISAATLARVVSHAREETSHSHRSSPLTPRETEVLRELAAGRQTREIADRLGLTVATVRTYVQEVLRKLESRSRLQAVMKAVREGLL